MATLQDVLNWGVTNAIPVEGETTGIHKTILFAIVKFFPAAELPANLATIYDFIKDKKLSDVTSTLLAKLDGQLSPIVNAITGTTTDPTLLTETPK